MACSLLRPVMDSAALDDEIHYYENPNQYPNSIGSPIFRQLQFIDPLALRSL